MNLENEGAKQYSCALQKSLRSQLGYLSCLSYIGTPFIFHTPSAIINAFRHARSSIHFLPLGMLKYTDNPVRCALCRLISSAPCLALPYLPQRRLTFNCPDHWSA